MVEFHYAVVRSLRFGYCIIIIFILFYLPKLSISDDDDDDGDGDGGDDCIFHYYFH